VVSFIQNVSMRDIESGNHFDAGVNSMLIQILDPHVRFPVPKHAFKEVHQFHFHDCDDGDEQIPILDDDYNWVYTTNTPISTEQARAIIGLLKKALENRMQVVVHCHAGLCRSGAVVEVGVMMGFADGQRYRQPNVTVKKRLMEVLNMTYESEK
jgi:predicted protein tyrosine phosphatase